MNKFIRRYRIIPVMICALLLTWSYAYAQDAQTKAYVTFEEGHGPTVPVNPENPDEEGNGEGEAGSLVIVRVSYFDFGTVPISYKREWHDITTHRPNIQVSDLRGTNVGWKVTASVTNFVNDDMEPSIPGASINISNGRHNSISTSPPPVPTPDLKLTTDGETFPVVTAGPGAGAGLWVMRWYPKKPKDPEEEQTEAAYVQLEIPPGSAQLGNHTATINWILENTPIA